jgi:uncharacterized membrane protein
MKTIKSALFSIFLGFSIIFFAFVLPILGQDGTDTPFTIDWLSLGIGAGGGLIFGGIIGSILGKHTRTGHVTLMKRGADSSTDSSESLKEKPKEKPPAKDKDLKGHVTLIK